MANSFWFLSTFIKFKQENIGGEFMQSNEGLEIKAVIELEKNGELYKLVDFLNKNLKSKGVIFGLTKKREKMNITLYELDN